MNTGKERKTWQFMFKKIFFSMMFACLITLAGQSACFASTVVLQWDPNTDTGLAGYKVYYQADSSTPPFKGTGATQGPSPILIDKATTTATISGLDPAHPYYFAVTAYNTSGVESAYSNIVSVPELVPPTVSLTYPANNASVSGTVAVSANASDNVGVTKVEFYVNGALQATDTSTPYLYSWNTTSLAAGSYTLMAKAYDAAGNVGQSSNVTVNVVNDTTAPTVSVTAPASGATVSGTVAIAATASDNVGVTKVEFYENGVLLSATNVSPYSYNWNTTSVANGSYNLTAKAYDAANNVGQSSTVAVTVNNTDTIPPTVSISAPANNATVSSTVSVTATASDNVGVTKVEFYVNNVLQATDSAAPYTFSWNTTALANGSYALSAKAYDAANNVGQSSTVTVTVNNTDTIPPTVSISAPANNATVSGTTSVTATASDNVGVTKVGFYVNNVLQATDTAAPFTFSWNTTTLANGSYALSAKAYDAANNVGQSATISVVVNNTATGGTYTVVFGNATGSNYPNTVADTYINIDNSVNATSTTLNTYTWPADKPANAILMKWDVSALPANAQIQSATLSLYLTGSGGDPLYGIPVSGIINKSPVIANCNGNTYDGTNAWTPSSVPYNNIPLAQSDIAPAVDTQQIDKTNGYKSWNVTDIVKGWVATAGSNKGLLLDSSINASSDSYRYFASSEATDASQRPKLVVTYNLGTDTTAPTVAITAPLDSATVSGNVTVAASASDNVGVSKVEFYVNNVLQATDTSSPYSFNWNTTSAANGSYTLSAKAYDAAGNVGQSSNISVTVNNFSVPPTSPIIINNGSPYTNKTTVSLALTYLGAASMQFTTNGTTWTAWGTYAATKNLTLPSGDVLKTVSVRFRDSKMVISDIYSATITLDTRAPVNGALTPTQLAGNQIKLEWAGFSDATSGIASYKLVRGATLPAASCTGTAIFTPAATDTTYTDTGSQGSIYYYRLCAVDNAGNTSTGATTPAVMAIPEVNKPSGTVSINQGNYTNNSITQGNYTNKAAVTLNVTASDAYANVAAYCISNTNTCTTWSKPATPVTPLSITAKPWTLAAGADGNRTVNVWFKDVWGNVSAPASAAIMLDTRAPVNGALTPTQLAGNQIRLDWTGFSDPTSAITSYKLVRGATLPAASCTGTAIFTPAATDTTYTDTGSQGSKYYYRLCAVDNAGNISTGATTPAVMAIPEVNKPSGTVSITQGNYTNKAAVTLNLTASDAYANVAAYCISNTNTCTTWSKPATPVTPLSITAKPWTLAAGADGNRTVNVWFKDVWGNVSAPASAAIMLDTRAPVNGALTPTQLAGNQIRLDWAGFSDATSGITSYKLVRGATLPAASCTGTAIFTPAATDTTYTDTGSQGSKYYYRLCAVDNAGNTSTGATTPAVMAIP
jgi:hypothetical protein